METPITVRPPDLRRIIIHLPTQRHQGQHITEAIGAGHAEEASVALLSQVVVEATEDLTLTAELGTPEASHRQREDGQWMMDIMSAKAYQTYMQTMTKVETVQRSIIVHQDHLTMPGRKIQANMRKTRLMTCLRLIGNLRQDPKPRLLLENSVSPSRLRQNQQPQRRSPRSHRNSMQHRKRRIWSNEMTVTVTVTVTETVTDNRREVRLRSLHLTEYSITLEHRQMDRGWPQGCAR